MNYMPGDSNIRRWYFAAFFFLGSLIFYVWQVFFSETGYNDGDSVTHYFISRHAFEHPILFLHLWGKPFFTLISSLFAVWGFNGIQLFNVICGSISAWLVFRSCIRLRIPHPLAGAVFALWTPVFYYNLPTGLTEIFFALVLISSIYLVLCRKYVAACLLISFLPFCRSEGYLILPLFAVFLIFIRKYRLLPLLFAGIILYSVAGLVVYNDILWLIKQNPYTGEEKYGNGSLFHFVEHADKITGILLLGCFVFALYIGLFYINKKLKAGKIEEKDLIEGLLVYGSFVIYFIAHSIFWWQGIFGSMGMTRVIAGVIPVFAIGSLRGLTFFTGMLESRYQYAGQMAIFLICVYVIINPVMLFGAQEHLDPRLKTVKEACEFLQKSKVKPGQVFYSHPFSVISMDIDPYEGKQSHELMWVPKNLITEIVGKHNYIVWDSQFGPVESTTPLELLQDSTRFEFIRNFEPSEEIRIFNGEKFEVKIFKVK
jgi:hypothetical protein